MNSEPEYRNLGQPTAGDWRVACDSYGRVRHSNKACIYTTLTGRLDTEVLGGEGERLVTIAQRIPSWADACLMAKAPRLRRALMDLVHEVQCGVPPGRMLGNAIDLLTLIDKEEQP